ncbi:F0F1 ATP synthase subunit A [Lichenifustis flavocetrariae]|uniref:ATP synthase subunit a n=1 Tax=Lichenifustis flavocetrariae TaxID=2949735 RepID=A0AA41Z3M5_9HYPH|nr:F0F1 ATP synthase subunit A [Lichenifustis flavocetrariae]MCW6512180.1 F0F1 ATP synthase subunit A [Lichenifustis flavocetrariae]
MTSPLASLALFHVGPVTITAAVIVTWAIMAVLTLGSVLVTRRLTLVPSRTQAAFELVVDTVDGQIRDTMQLEPGPYRAFVGTLFVFIFVANWSSLVPGVGPPTAKLETDAALALLVFVAVIWFGIRAGGLRGYLATFASPNPVMIPLNFIESLTRTFSLLVRLFGNVMSGVFVIGIVLSLAGFLVPIPLMALDLLTGAVQAYIFAILAMVFIAGAVGRSTPRGRSRRMARSRSSDRRRRSSTGTSSPSPSRRD